MDNNQKNRVGLAEHLSIVGDKLLVISRELTDNEEKMKIFEEVYNFLNDDLDRIQEMAEGMTPDEKAMTPVDEIMENVHEPFRNSAKYFISVVEFYKQFLEDENPAHIESARTFIAEGVRSLDEAHDAFERIKELSQSSVPDTQEETPLPPAQESAPPVEEKKEEEKKEE